MRSTLPSTLSALLFLVAASCGDAGVATIRIQLNPDLSGTVTTSSLLVAAQPGPLEAGTAGVTWSDRANLYCSSGVFQSLDGLRIADIAFEQVGEALTRVTLPRGKSAQWPAAFTPDQADRAKVTKTFDPRDQLANATTHLSIEIDFPKKVVSSDVDPPARGLTAAKEKERRATLVVPVDRAAGEGEPFTWHITVK